jgi:hypothetical protein
MGIGGEILDYVGGTVRWIYGTIWRTITHKKRYTFREYQNGPDDSDDLIFDRLGHSIVNRVVGMVSLMVLIIFLLKI